MGDKTAVIWTRYGGEPKKIGQVVHTGTEVRLTYARGAPCGVSIFHDARQLAERTIPFPVDADLPLPPYLAALLPPRHSPLWTFLLDRVTRRQGPPSADDALWEVLLEGGRNGVGHLDVFKDDSTAEHWYGASRTPKILGEDANRRGLWDVFRDLAAHTITDTTARIMTEAVGPTPGVTGMIPKMLVTADCGWLETGNTGSADVMVKTEPAKYEGLLSLESACYGIHETLTCATPRHWLKHTPTGSPILVSERFDRNAGMPIPTETAYSLMRMQSQGKIRQRWSDPHITGSNKAPGEIVPRLEHLASMFAKANGPSVFGFAAGQEKELYRRVALALMTGNSDLHLENLSFLGPRGEARLTPVYDPAPMRCFDQHAMVFALDFASLGLTRRRRQSDLWEKYLEFAGTLNIRRDVAAGILRDCRDAAEGYADLVMSHAEQRAEETTRRSMRHLATELGHENGFLATALGDTGKHR